MIDWTRQVEVGTPLVRRDDVSEVAHLQENRSTSIGVQARQYCTATSELTQGHLHSQLSAATELAPQELCAVSMQAREHCAVSMQAREHCAVSMQAREHCAVSVYVARGVAT